jgi:hypothetical protein
VGDSKTVNRVPDKGGASITVPLEQAASLLTNGYHAETGADVATHAQQNADEAVYGGAAGTVLATGAGVASGLSGGLTDAGVALLGGGEQLRKLKEHHEIANTIGTIAGSLSPTGVGGLAARAGERVAGAIGGAGVRAVIGAGAGTAIEGGILGAGQGVSELALSDEPVTFEHAASVIGSNALFGACDGRRGRRRRPRAPSSGSQRRSRRSTRSRRRQVETTADVAEDLAGLDRKGLRAAEKTELDAIEAARVPAARAGRRRDPAVPQGAEGEQALARDEGRGGVGDPRDRQAHAQGGPHARQPARRPEGARREPEVDAVRTPQAGGGARRAREQARAVAAREVRDRHERRSREGPRLRVDRARAQPRAAGEDHRAVREAGVEAPRGDPGRDRPLERAEGRRRGPVDRQPLGDVALGHAVGALTGIPYVGPAIAAGKMSPAS